ncbi:MAG: hypothetical protein IPK86_02580 [Neisseriales bacterium]|nr:MAG: hypothetical protein IPK86_02580 [Neisseriales bacterium]
MGSRNFSNPLGQDTNVFLGSVELSAICAKLDYIPIWSEYRQHIQVLQDKQNDTVRSHGTLTMYCLIALGT